VLTAAAWGLALAAIGSGSGCLQQLTFVPACSVSFTAGLLKMSM
jgi:hypothetical protein